MNISSGIYSKGCEGLCLEALMEYCPVEIAVTFSSWGGFSHHLG